MTGAPPIAWSMAGSDPSAGGGLQADLKTFAALGAHGCTVITALTAQNTGTVRATSPVSSAMLADQITVLRDDLPPRAIKIGMLGDAAGVRVIAEALDSLAAYTVYDPVMISSSGTALMGDETLAAMRELLLPRVDLLTPNRAETEFLTGLSLRNDADVERAANTLLALGPKAVVIKGWDSGAGLCQDYFCSSTMSFWLTLPKRDSAVPRGTGCTMASALAAAHAFGFDESDAAVIAKAYVHRCLRQSHKRGGGAPLAEHQAWPPEPEDFPWLTATAEGGPTRLLFPDCGTQPLGFYPVVDSVAWLRRLLPLGVTTAQLRVKNLNGEALAEEIRQAVLLSRQYKTRLFINDYWRLAIDHGAYGIHVGQEDLDTTDLTAIAASGLRLGISTHSYAEAARAHALRPSYIALGPIFPTTLKSMRFAPQGLDTLKIWRSLFTCPLVAIGGITLESAHAVRKTGVDSIAVVSDITQNADPEGRVRQWMQAFR